MDDCTDTQNNVYRLNPKKLALLYKKKIYTHTTDRQTDRDIDREAERQRETGSWPLFVVDFAFHQHAKDISGTDVPRPLYVLPQ